MRMRMEVAATDDDLKQARDLAWKHFQLHAGHRIEMFKAYVAFGAIIYAGYGASLQYKYYLVGFILSVLLILLSVIFYLFDTRIKQLLKISERYLLDDELKLSAAIDNPNIRLFKKSNVIADIPGLFATHYIRVTYSALFKNVYALNILVAGLMFVVLIVLNAT